MRITIVSKDRKSHALCKREALKYGLKYDEKNPEIVIAYGGDGTVLHAERIYPSAPKLLVRNSSTCRQCHKHSLHDTIKLLARKRYREEDVIKLEARIIRKRKIVGKVIGLNDIILRNKNLSQAIRFSLSVDKKELFDMLIGDGLVVATPFGSTAYYQSITKDSFSNGIGVAFNNLSTEHMSSTYRPGVESKVKSEARSEVKRSNRKTEPPRKEFSNPTQLFLDPSVTLEVKILRGPAEVAGDNQRIRLTLKEGDLLRVKESRRKGHMIKLFDDKEL